MLEYGYTVPAFDSRGCFTDVASSASHLWWNAMDAAAGAERRFPLAHPSRPHAGDGPTASCRPTCQPPPRVPHVPLSMMPRRA